jgi:hypothetical protein
MKSNIIISVLLCFLTITGAKATQTDIVNQLTGLLKTSNSREISKHFASTVELIILNEEDVYSKVQAEMILKDFLSKHEPRSAQVIHRLDSNPSYKFAVIELETENGTFRTTISLKDTGGRFLITEMRIEFDKE